MENVLNLAVKRAHEKSDQTTQGVELAVKTGLNAKRHVHVAAAMRWLTICSTVLYSLLHSFLLC